MNVSAMNTTSASAGWSVPGVGTPRAASGSMGTNGPRLLEIRADRIAERRRNHVVALRRRMKVVHADQIHLVDERAVHVNERNACGRRERANLVVVPGHDGRGRITVA